MEQNQSLFDLQIDQQGLSYLGEAARWARFVAICGFIFCALMVMAGFFMGTMMTAMMGAVSSLSAIGSGFITFFYLLLAAIWFLPCLFLFRFGSQMQLAVRNNQQDKLHQSLSNLKSYFKFIGVLFIIVLTFYALAIVGGVIAGMAIR